MICEQLITKDMQTGRQANFRATSIPEVDKRERVCVNNVRDSYVAGAQKRKSKHLSDSSKTRTHDRETTFRQTG
jgi:hypothetical protein